MAEFLTLVKSSENTDFEIFMDTGILDFMCLCIYFCV